MRLPCRHSKGRAFILPLALVFLFVLLLLEVGLVSLQQIAEENTLTEASRLASLVGSEEIYAHLGEAIETNAPSGPANLDGRISYKVPQSQLVLSANWNDQKSQNFPLPATWASFENILKGNPGLPKLSYYTSSEDNALPIGHSRLELANSATPRATRVANFSHTFPYGIYAPKGSITASSISSFANPLEYESDQPITEETGRPVDLCAGRDITVSDFYSSGRALSVQGNVSLPSGTNSPGAIAFSGHPIRPNPWETQFQNLVTLSNTVAEGSLDKTGFFDDQVFTSEHLRQLFSGDMSGLESIFGVGQACKVPFFPIPAVQDDVLLFVFYIHHPYPVDFSGVARSGDDSKKLEEKSKELQVKQEELKEKQEELDAEQSKKDPDKSKVKSLKGEVSDLEEEIDKLNKQIEDLSKKLSDDADDIQKNITQSKVPQTGTEDAEQVTKGWSYLFILSDILKFAVDLISGKDPFEAVFEPCRVIHLGGSNPGWNWSDGSIDMKANLTVPRGRTLQLSKSHVKVRGDVYLQEGAVLKIDGNLTVEVPGEWTDFKGVEASDYGGFPNGRVIIEEGASLIVSGDLDVQGGSYHEGSILVSSEYGPNNALTRLVQAGGDITLKHGMTPVVKFGDLVDELAHENKALQGFNDDFFRPLVEEVFTVTGKMPYVGPWQWRKSWFASYATTFEFIPWLEEFGLGGPWPIPLPYDNCLIKVFNYMSMIYSVELNAMTGENLYTHSPFWLFGQGVTPVFLKVNPKLVEDDLAGLEWGKITLESIEEEALAFLKDDMPKFAVNVIENIITEIIEQSVRSLIPFNPPSCGSKENEEAKEIEEVVEEFLKDALKEFGGIAKRSFQKILLTMKNEVYNHINGSDEAYSVNRQLPGIVVAAGGQLNISQDTQSILALGLLIAENDINIGSNQTVGTVISLEGRVNLEALLHYPYFDRVSLYQPKKHVDVFTSLLEFGDPTGSNAGDVSPIFARRVAEGWK